MSSWAASVRATRERFLNQCRQRLSEADNHFAVLLERPWESSHLLEVRRIAHQMAGSSGFFDMKSVSTLALECEGNAIELQSRLAAVHTDRDAHVLKDSIKSLKAKFDRLKEVLETDCDDSAEESAQNQDQNEEVQIPRPVVLLVSGDPRQSLEIQGSLEEAGMEVETYRTAKTARGALDDSAPQALVILASSCDEAVWELLTTFRVKFGDRPVFLLSKQEQFLEKVLAIKLGVDFIFEQPFDLPSIVSRLTRLVFKMDTRLYRVLSVEDDPVQQAIISQTLNAAGYTVLSISDPAEFEEALISFNPDLVLLDVDLGIVSGFDLARFVRQADRFANLPVVFLTTRNQLSSFVDGARAGGDEYLVKPVSTQYLTATIAQRIERYKVLSGMLEKDGLTQLLNYSNFILRCQTSMRSGSTGDAITLFNIDHLTEINRANGLPSGDRAIAAVASVLRSVYRGDHMLGRTGGDEFAVFTSGLSDRDLAEVSLHVIDRIRRVEGFDRPLSVSCGIASTHFESGADDALRRARLAISTAKANGGGCVVKG